MKCSKTENLMMQHFEKTIKPKNAQRLAKHVISCGGCRELYLAFDEAAEYAESLAAEGAEKLDAPPLGFTESVMAKVRAEIPQVNAGELVASRFLWGIGALILGLGLMLALNPQLVYYLPESLSLAFYAVVSSVGGFFYGISAQSGTAFPVEGLSATALFFVAVMGLLLCVLQRGDDNGQVKT